VAVSVNVLPGWLSDWCRDRLGSSPVAVLFQRQQVSTVFGLRLADGVDVVVKARADEGRAESCVAAQLFVASRGFPCPRPLTPVTRVGSLAVHAEQYRPGGEVVHGDSPAVAVRCAAVFARLMALLAQVSVAPPLPNPPWVAWDHTAGGVWPALDVLDSRDQSTVPDVVVEVAERVGRRVRIGGLVPAEKCLRAGQVACWHPWAERVVDGLLGVAAQAGGKVGAGRRRVRGGRGAGSA